MRSTRYKVLPYEAACYHEDSSPHFLQWWYFDAEFENGYYLMASMCPRAFGIVDKDGNKPDPTVTITITDPELRNLHSRQYYPGEFSGDPDRMRVAIGQNRMECRDGRYQLLLNQDGLGCELEYIPQLPPWVPTPGRGGYMPRPLVWLSQMRWAKGIYFHYSSLIPKAKVKGKLILPDQEIEVKGVGYHEQGRTNAPLQNVFTYWCWIRFYSGDWTFIFPLGESPRRTLNAKMRALLVYYRNEPVADIFDPTGLFLNHRVRRYELHPASGREIPVEFTFRARWPGLKLKIDMELSHERECWPFQPFDNPPPLQPVWLQHFMRYKVEMRWKGRPIVLEGQGLFENMLTGAI